MDLYLSNDGEPVGPYSREQIQIFVNQGLLSTTDQIWAEEWPTWMKVGQVLGIGLYLTANSSVGSPVEKADAIPPRQTALTEFPTNSEIGRDEQDEPGKLPPSTDFVLANMESDSKGRPNQSVNEMGHNGVDVPQIRRTKGLKVLLMTLGACGGILLVLWLIGASYKKGVQSGADAGARAGFSQGVQAGAEDQAKQDIATVNQTVSDVEAVRDAEQQSSPGATNSDDPSEPDPSPSLVVRPDGTIAPAPGPIIPQYNHQE